jgi:hypothetical protein
MVYLRSVLAGAGATLLFVLVSAEAVMGPMRGTRAGGTDASAFASGPIFWTISACVFAAGFLWEFRRGSR